MSNPNVDNNSNIKKTHDYMRGIFILLCLICGILFFALGPGTCSMCGGRGKDMLIGQDCKMCAGKGTVLINR